MSTRILLVEDQADVRHVAKLWLERLEFEVVEAENGAVALAILPGFDPDLVLTDLAMPVMDGVELCRSIKSDPGTQDIPVLMFTSHTDAEAEVAGTSAGADAYVAKGGDPRILKARIEALVAARTRNTEAVERELDTARRQTLGQTVITLTHHLNNSLISIHAAASVIDPERTDDARKLKQICQTEARKMLVVLRALKEMAEHEELKTTTYVNDELMFDLEAELSRLANPDDEGS